jgi:hypothetical protein
MPLTSGAVRTTSGGTNIGLPRLRARAIALTLMLVEQVHARETTGWVALEAGYALPFTSLETSPDRAGLGLLVGADLPSRFWVGGALTAHVGSSLVSTGPENRYTFRAWNTYLGPELGYSARAGNLVVRPTVGFGALFGQERIDVRGATSATDRLDVFVAPGAVLAFAPEPWMLGLHARMPIAFDREIADWAVAVYAVAGWAWSRR